MVRKISINKKKDNEVFVLIISNSDKDFYIFSQNKKIKKISSNKKEMIKYLKDNKISKKYICELENILNFNEFIEYLGIEKNEYKENVLNKLYIEFFGIMDKYSLVDYKVILKNDFGIYLGTENAKVIEKTKNFIVYN